jgi:hypothetical protein
MSNIGFFAYNTSILNYTLRQKIKYLIKEHNLFIFHIDSLTKDRAVNENSVKDISQYDISYMSINNMIQLIKKLNIETFIFYTFQSKIDRILWKLCVLLDIPTILHDHGIVFGTTPARKPFKFSKQFLSRNFQILKKMFQLKVYTYIHLNKVQRISLIKKFNNYSFQYYVLYSKKNIEYYQGFFILNNHNTILSSIPLFETFNSILLVKEQQVRRKLLYIHQPFIKFDFTTLSFDEEIGYIKKINGIAKKNNLMLEIRFHPSQSLKCYNCLINESNIILSEDIDLSLQAASSCAILGHWSTALAIAHPLQKPLIIIEYPNIVEQMRLYHSIYKDVGCYCEDLFELDDVLKKIDAKDYIYERRESEWKDLIGSTNTVEFNCEKLKDVINKVTHN